MFWLSLLFSSGVFAVIAGFFIVLGLTDPKYRKNKNDA